MLATLQQGARASQYTAAAGAVAQGSARRQASAALPIDRMAMALDTIGQVQRSLAENRDPLELAKWSTRPKAALTLESPPVPSLRDDMVRYIAAGCGTFDVELARMAIALREASRTLG